MGAQRVLLVVLVAATMLWSGCGGDDTDDAPATDGGLPGDVDGGGQGEGDGDGDSAPEPGSGVGMRLGSLDDGFYNQPWPLSTRLRDDGTLDLTDLPTAASAAFINNNLDLIQARTPGFSTNGAILMSFTDAVDADTLPADAEASLDDDAGVYLMNVDEDSEELGERTPILCSYRDADSAYNPPHFLSCLPLPGFSLRPATLYALVVTDAVLDADGEPLVASVVLRDALEANDPGDEGSDEGALTAALIDAFAPLADHLLAEGIALGSIAGATVFRTQDPTAQLRAVAEQLADWEPPAPAELQEYGGTLPAESGNYRALQGTFEAPIYQQGETPYQNEGGDLQFEPDGTPIQATTLPVRFAITVPDGDMPAGGWPLAIYHHGTGGDAFSHIDDGTAYHLAEAGVAVLGLDAPVHGTRRPAGADPQGLFFNITNVLALRDNIRQGAIDLLAAERFALSLELDAGSSPLGEALRFDGDELYVMGHSQGALTAPLMLALSTHARAAMLSGAGASITGSILYKTSPVNIPVLARQFLGLGASETLDAFHPVLAIVQAFSDAAESSNYVPYFYRWEGGRGIDLWITSGLMDQEAPPEVTAPLGVAAAVALVEPVAEPLAGIALRGIGSEEAPVIENVEARDGERYTGVYTQYPDDGHFLIFRNPDAEARLEHWFGTLAAGGHAELR